MPTKREYRDESDQEEFSAFNAATVILREVKSIYELPSEMLGDMNDVALQQYG